MTPARPDRAVRLLRITGALRLATVHNEAGTLEAPDLAGPVWLHNACGVVPLRVPEHLACGSFGPPEAVPAGRSRMVERNIGLVELWVRVLAGNFASLGGMWILAADPVLTERAFGVVLLVAGGYLIVTGARRYCPIYRRLGLNTAQDRRRDDA
jgi:hypothetical protein